MNDPSGALARRLIGLALPVAIGRLGIVGMGLVDTIVVGQIAPQELAYQAAGAIAGYVLWAPSIRPYLARLESRVEAGYRPLLTIGAAAALSG